MTWLSPEDNALLEKFKAWKHRPKEFRPGTDDDPTPQQAYADLMKSRFAPSLRQVGLKGSNGRFELPSDKYWTQLGFQKSAFSDGREVRFTVNLSVIDRAQWDDETVAKPYLGARPSPGTHYGTIQQHARLGQLVTGGQDLWWRLVRGEDPTPVADEVVDALLGFAVPWLVAQSAE